MKWFMHQSAAHRDTKLKKVLMKYGAEGYGLYWFCIEHICADVDPKLTFELEHDSEILAHELKIDTLKVQEIMLYMVNLGLFEISENVIYCIKLARYLGDKNTRNPDLKAIIQAQKVHIVPDSPRHVPDSPRQSALEERRGEENKYLSDKSDDCREVFDYWLKVMGKNPNQVKFSPERKTKIQQRLKDYSVEQIKRGINGCKRSAHHMGKNDSNTKYNDIELICRNATKLESFIEMGAAPASYSPRDPNSFLKEVSQ